MSTQRATAPVQARRPIPDSVWLAWLVALGVLVVLGINVVRHLAAGSATDSTMTSMPGMTPDSRVTTSLVRDGNEPAGRLLSAKLFTAWQIDAIALAVLVILGAAYVTGVLLARRRHPDQPWPLRRILFFFAGLLVCAYATCGAIAVYDQALFTAHMLGHLCLVMAAPALLIAGRPMTLSTLAAKPARAARIKRIAGGRVVSLLTAPPVALACYTAVIVGSHLTGLMDTIMRNTWAGQVEHLVYVLVGMQFFVLVVGDEPIRWRLSTPARWGLLAVAMAVDTFTGVILMMNVVPVAMFPPPSLHVDPLSDTHTGGAIMWFGGDAIMAVVMVSLVIAWLRVSGTMRRDTTGWLEQARQGTLGDRAGAATAPAVAVDSGAGFDDDEDRLTAYNEWLNSISRPRGPSA
jgi:putative copper resistance protein D